MIFSDFNFLVLIFLPYLFYALVLHRRAAVPSTVKLGLLIALSAAYYVQGPAADPVLYAAFVAANVAFVLLPMSARVIVIACLVNLVALLLIKGLRPAGAPLAISFLTFQVVGLLVTKVRAGGLKITLAEFLFLPVFFPHMVAGPIIQWGDISRYLARLREGVTAPRNWDLIILFLAIGLAKKTLIADRLFVPISHLQDGTATFGFIDSAMFPVLYGLYLYFDFSSYSDIATGLAFMIGLRFPINFYSPYRALDPRAFWRRWHRTLYRFLRNHLGYLYRRLGLPRGWIFVLFVFMFSGLWHGVGPGFALWAFGHALWFLLYPRRLMARLPVPIRWAINLAVVMVLWVPFALKPEAMAHWANGLTSLGIAFERGPAGFSNMFITRYDLLVMAVAGAIALVLPNAFQWARVRSGVIKRVIYALLLLAAWPYLIDPSSPRVPFAYFQF